MKKLAKIIYIAVVGALFSPAFSARAQEIDISNGAKPKQVRLEENSDWWSTVRDDGASLPAGRPLRRFPSNSTFNIGGVQIRSENWEKQVRETFGTTTEIERGDAASGRHQWCYRSLTGDRYLVFETGEVVIGFYLLDHPVKWTGEKYCKETPAVNETMRTAAGLRLGMTIAEVTKQLGKPSRQQGNFFLYTFEGRHKTTIAERKKLRQGNQMSDEEFEQNFAYLDLMATINVKFSNSKATLIYVADTDVF